jgi:hypothetical protein
VDEGGSWARSRFGTTDALTRIGVVLGVVNYRLTRPPRYELHVDAAVDGGLDGVGCWDPWIAVLSNDAESVAEARRLGLDGLADHSQVCARE